MAVSSNNYHPKLTVDLRYHSVNILSQSDHIKRLVLHLINKIIEEIKTTLRKFTCPNTTQQKYCRRNLLRIETMLNLEVGGKS